MKKQESVSLQNILRAISFFVYMNRFLLSILFLLSVIGVKAQNLPTVDDRMFHFGFNLGVNVMDYGIRNTLLQADDGKVYQADITTLMPGFSVGVIGDMRLGRYFNMRLVPMLHLGDKTLSFSNDKDDGIFKTTVKSTMITVPLHFKYSAVRIRDYRPYIFVGGGVLFELGHDSSKPVLSRYIDYFVEFGVGCTIYTQYFRLAPEFKFALGFNNMITPWDERMAGVGDGFIEPEYEKYNRAISRLTSRLFTFVINFE